MTSVATAGHGTARLLRQVARRTARSTGRRFFRDLVQALAEVLGYRYCMVTECLDRPVTRVGTLAFWAGDSFAERFEYDLDGTPCSAVLAGEWRLFEDRVQCVFPRDQDLVDLDAESYVAVPFEGSGGDVLGHLALIHTEPIREDDVDLALLEIFAARAGAELERQRAAARVKASETRLRQIIDLVPHFIFAKDREGRFLLANQASAEAYGTTVENLMGKTDGDFARSAEEAAQFRGDDREVIDSGAVKFIPEEPFTDAGGGSRVLQTMKIPFAYDDGEAATAVLGVAIDITELKRMEEQRRVLQTQVLHAQKLESLGVLAGGIAHDFNNLLSGILGNAGLALMQLPEGSPARSCLDEIEKAAVRSAELANQMLAYSGKGRFVVERLHLGELVAEMADLLRGAISKKSHLDLDLPADLPSLEADATQLRQVVMNLITNASEALGDDGGHIRVRAFAADVEKGGRAPFLGDKRMPPGTYVCLEVEDDGCGMDSATVERLFEPFFTTKLTGRGLGMAAVQGIVRGHRGAIQVVSRPEEGTLFRLALPATGAATAPDAKPAARQSAWRGRGTVLLADDEELVIKVASRVLERLGFEVLSARDGRAAVDLFQAHGPRIDIVLLDMSMPELDGLQALEAMRNLRPDLKALLSSGYGDLGSTVVASEVGVSGFVKKPYRPQELEDAVRRAFEDG
ncbi:MAG: response regulator [Acidobacteriota bacterium]